MSVLPTPIFLHGLQRHDELFVDIERGKTLVIRFLAVGEANSVGKRVAFFELNGQPYQALNGGPDFSFSEAISIVLACDSQEESDQLWEALGDGGEFGPCGWLKDKFGLSWQIYPAELDDLFADPVPERARAAMQCMLQQSRIDLAEIRAAMDAANAG